MKLYKRVYGYFFGLNEVPDYLWGWTAIIDEENGQSAPLFFRDINGGLGLLKDFCKENNYDLICNNEDL